MARAVELAGHCRPDKADIPKVGAVIVDADGKLISEERRRDSGTRNDHAERRALDKVPDRKLLPDATLYTTLEPCTPDVRSKAEECCTNLIIASGIKRVFVGILDPNQGVCGKGVNLLQAAGIDIEFFQPDFVKQVRSDNNEFIVSQQTYGIHFASPTAGHRLALDSNGYATLTARGNFELPPGMDVYAVVRHGGQLWPQRERLSTTGDKQWEVRFHFGAKGAHDLAIVKANPLGMDLINYYYKILDVGKRREDWIDAALKPHKDYKELREKVFAKGFPKIYTGITLASALPKGLEVLDEVRVELT